MNPAMRQERWEVVCKSCNTRQHISHVLSTDEVVKAHCLFELQNKPCSDASCSCGSFTLTLLGAEHCTIDCRWRPNTSSMKSL